MPDFNPRGCQKGALAPYNWLLNAGEHPDGEPRRFCPIQRHLVGQSDYAQALTP